MTLDSIKEAIQLLPVEERRKLADWFDEIEEAAWDEEMRRDFAPGGRGESFANQIRQEIAGGRATPLQDGLASRRTPRS